MARRISFRELDFWLMKGFGGIINILQGRVTQIKHGFARISQKLLAQEVRRIGELNDAVQANPQEEYPEDRAEMASLDNWFIMAFTGLDRYLSIRSEEGPTPISPENLSSVEDHISRLQSIVSKEREKWQSSHGKSAA